MARKTISQRIALLGSEEIRKELAALGERGEAAFRDIQAAAEKLRGPGAEFARNMDRARQRIRDLGKEFDRVGTRIRNFGAGISVGVTAPLSERPAGGHDLRRRGHPRHAGGAAESAATGSSRRPKPSSTWRPRSAWICRARRSRSARR